MGIVKRKLSEGRLSGRQLSRGNCPSNGNYITKITYEVTYKNLKIMQRKYENNENNAKCPSQLLSSISIKCLNFLLP